MGAGFLKRNFLEGSVKEPSEKLLVHGAKFLEDAQLIKQLTGAF